MSIVKKLPAVLIAAVGISFSVAGTALAEEPIFAERTLASRDDFIIKPPDRRNTTICYKATDNLEPYLLMAIADRQGGFKIISIPYGIERAGLEVSQESDHQCITMTVGYSAMMTNVGRKELNESQSVHVYARQYTTK